MQPQRFVYSDYRIVKKNVLGVPPTAAAAERGRAIRSNLFCGGRQKRISTTIPHVQDAVACFISPVSHPERVAHRGNKYPQKSHHRFQ